MAATRKPMTLTQKILCHHATGLKRPWVEAGDTLRIRVDWTIASELAWNGMNATYEKHDRPPIFSRERFYLALDHTVDPETLANDARTQRLVQLSRDFAQVADPNEPRKRPPEIAQSAFDDPGVKTVRELARTADAGVVVDSPLQSHSPGTISLQDADCLPPSLGELVDRHLGGQELHPDRVDLGVR